MTILMLKLDVEQGSLNLLNRDSVTVHRDKHFQDRLLVFEPGI